MSSVLKVNDLPGFCKFALQKNLIGSAVAGSVGGFNGHVANTVAAAYLATGQDVAQVVDAAAAITLLEVDGDGIRASLTVPCIEVGFRGGGTCLPHQSHYLKTVSGCSNLDEFAKIIAVGALGGEISLLSGLFNSGELVQSHEKLNK
jgi:hydroxymethylglutaryl-CoA reductase (NADPH)